MPPKNDRRPWIKLWVDECLRGTVREEMTPEERGVWYDFLLLAGNNRVRGRISANETQPQSPARIAAILNIEENLVSHCVGKFMEQGRITVDERGIIHITNWDSYQYSSYDRSKPYRQKKSLQELNQRYLDDHPEQVIGSTGDDNYEDTPLEDEPPLARGDESLEEHEEALMQQNPAVRAHKEKLERDYEDG